MKKVLFCLFAVVLMTAVSYSQESRYDIGRYMYSFSNTMAASDVDTVSTKINSSYTSLTSLFNTWCAGDIITNDTLEVSTSVSFPAGQTWLVLPTIASGSATDVPFEIPKLMVRSEYITNYYIRVYNGVGTPFYILRLWGM